MAHVYKRPDPQPQPRPPRPSSGQDTAAAFLIIILMLLGAGGIYNLVSGVMNNQAVVGRDRWGREIVSAPWSPVWWMGMILCSGTFLYCGYLMVQLLHKK